tara:strand:- start:1424 stop:1843 length:420 start_codon:yes stop_codon:yes gene_type:complete
MNYQRLKQSLKRHEGVRDRIYKCSAGYNTIAVGHNLDTMPLSGRVIDLILEDDIEIAIRDIKRNIMYFDDLPEEVQETLVNMCFNLGISRLLLFKNMFEAIQEEDWSRAADEALDSKWAKQVGYRAEELAGVLRRQAHA